MTTDRFAGCANEICAHCGDLDWYHAAIDKCLGGERMTDTCRVNCVEFRRSGRFQCQDVVKGDIRSPRGTNRYTPCGREAKWLVTYGGGSPLFRVCGLHGKHTRKYYPELVTEIAKGVAKGEGGSDGE